MERKCRALQAYGLLSARKLFSVNSSVKRSAPHFFSWPLTVMQATNTHCTVTVGVNRTIITNNFQNVVFIFKQTGTANKLTMYN